MRQSSQTSRRANKFAAQFATEQLYPDLCNAYGWYDLTITVDSDASFVRRVAGHVETGRPGYSDPALGG